MNLLKDTSREEEYICGGSDDYFDKDALKEIKSNNIVVFSMTSAFNDFDFVYENTYDYISFFFAPIKDGSFLFLEKHLPYDDIYKKETYYIKENIMDKLNELVKEEQLIKKNGSFHTTYGLPQNFGGEVMIVYDSGETINYADNQESVFSLETAKKIENIFIKASKGKKIDMPNVNKIKKIEYAEVGKDTYVYSTLYIDENKKCVLKRKSKYGDSVYEKTKDLDRDVVSKILKNIEENCLLVWPYLIEKSFKYREDKTITIVFDNEEIVIDNKRMTPEQISNGFFNIELILTN